MNSNRCKNLTLESLLREDVEQVGVYEEKLEEVELLSRWMEEGWYCDSDANSTVPNVMDHNSFYLLSNSYRYRYHLSIDKGVWKWEKEEISDDFKISTSLRGRGKLSKMLYALGYEEKSVLSATTLMNAGSKKYEVVLSNNFYSHYIKMKEKDICTSCMAYNKDFYNIEMEWGEESPLIAYETDPDWALALVKEVGKKDYPYVGRAVYHRPSNSIVSVYGQCEVSRKALSEVGIERVDCWGEVGATLVILEDNGGGKILPYLDGDSQNCDTGWDATKGDVWTTGGGEWYGCYDTGVASGGEGFTCTYCSDTVDGDPEATDVYGDPVCYSCVVNGEVVFCETAQEYYPYDHSDICEVAGNYYLTSDDDIGWCESREEYCFTDDLRWSEYHEAWIHENDAVAVEDDYLYQDDEGDVWCYGEDDDREFLAEA